MSDAFWTQVMVMSRELQKPENCKNTLLPAEVSKIGIRERIDGVDARICPVIAVFLDQKISV